MTPIFFENKAESLKMHGLGVNPLHFLWVLIQRQKKKRDERDSVLKENSLRNLHKTKSVRCKLHSKKIIVRVSQWPPDQTNSSHRQKDEFPSHPPCKTSERLSGLDIMIWKFWTELKFQIFKESKFLNMHNISEKVPWSGTSL